MATDAAYALIPDTRLQSGHNPEDPRRYDPEGMALCLSGGGYKAAAFHLGGLIRLNEVGLLGRLKRIASVSGGSIAAGYLGFTWSKLAWTEGRADNFDAEFVQPLRRFLTTASIDIPAAVAGLLLPFRSGADGVEAAYRKHLFGDATLQNLPDEADAPRFVILATNYELNSLWRFSRAYAADYRVGLVRNPRFPLARIVAASSGFPPFFCPIDLDLGPTLEPLDGADRHEAPFTRRARLADGGVYDNMGLEPIWKRYGILLVSNAGDPFKETDTPPRQWLPMLQRILGMIHRQAENNRVRWLMTLARDGERKLAYWPLRNTTADYSTPGRLPQSDDEVKAAMAEPVRLWALKPDRLGNLVRHGYALADAAVRAHLPVGDVPAPRFPNV